MEKQNTTPYGNAMIREPLIISGGKNIDLRSNLLKSRIIMLDTDFNPHMAGIIVQQLLYLDTENQDPIEIYINSPGGCVVSGLAIYDTIKAIKSPVHTTAVGMAASMGAFMLTCGGVKGKRSVMPNAQVMFHEVSAGTSGRVSDMEVRFEHTKHLNLKLHKLIAEATGKKLKEVLALFEKDVWLEGDAVVKFGAADAVLQGAKS